MRPARAPAELTPQLALLAWVGAFLVGNISSAAAIGVAGHAGDEVDQFPLWLVAVNFFLLWFALLAALLAVSRHTGTGSLRRDFGARARPGDALVGIPAGVIAQLVFVRLLYDALDGIFDTDDLDEPAKQLTGKASGIGVVLLVLVVVVGAPIVEELFYRGLFLRAFKARVNDGLAVFITALLFALAHFQLLQLPGLVLFGLLAGYLANRYGRLGPAIFAHVGFNAAAVVVLLSDRW